jgi:hypothetical protein
MTDQPQHREYEGDYYGGTHQKLAQQANHFGGEDRGDARAGVDGQTEKAASQYSVSQGDHLLQGQSTRGDAPVPDQHYPSSTHVQLYNMVNTNLNPESLDDRGRVANKLGNWLADVSTAAKDAAGSSEVEWQGPAASQAHGFFQATASYAEQSGGAAQLSSNRYSQQAAAAANAQKYMPPPSGFNQAAEMNKATQQLQSGDLVGGTNAMNAIAAKQQQAQADHDQAVRVMQDLDNTYHGTAGTQPTYTPPPQLGGDNGSTFASSAHVSAPGGTAQGPGFTGSGGTPGTGQGSISGAGNQFSGSAGAGTGLGASGSAPGFGGGAATGSGPGGANFATGGVRGGVAGFGGGPRMSPDGMSMLSGAPGGGGSGGDITRSRSGPGSGRAGSGFAGSRVSGGGYKPGKPGVPGEVEGKPGAGKASGSGTVSERLERGATAAGAKAVGAGGAGAAGAGAGKKKEEDKEHKNKIPLQVDPEEAFEVRPERGPDGETITPPVIGG